MGNLGAPRTTTVTQETFPNVTSNVATAEASPVVDPLDLRAALTGIGINETYADQMVAGHDGQPISLAEAARQCQPAFNMIMDKVMEKMADADAVAEKFGLDKEAVRATMLGEVSIEAPDEDTKKKV
jgi:hypothetical protein